MIAAGLSSSSKVVNLELGKHNAGSVGLCRIGAEGAKAIGIALAANTSLEYLNFGMS